MKILSNANIEVRLVPPFCEHWRKHYTWKIWCINNIEVENVIWLDAGICVLDKLDMIINVQLIENGYFLVPNYQFLVGKQVKKPVERVVLIIHIGLVKVQ